MTADTARGINPVLRRLWRADGSLQLGIDPRRAVVIEGLTASDEPLLMLLDGSRDLRAAAELAGVTAERAASVEQALRTAGVLHRTAAGHAAVPQQLVPDALSASLVDPHRCGATTVLRRALRCIEVLGAGRVGATLAALLAAAGVGEVRCTDDAATRLADLAPGGLRPGPLRSRGAAAGQLVGRVASAGGGAARRPLAPPRQREDARPDLIVLAPAGAVTAPEQAAAARSCPHLEVVVRETTAAIGPLVVPGRTACRRCAELARVDRDPQWPVIAAQLLGSARTEACDLTLAATAAGLTAAHVLRWLDGLDADRAGPVTDADHPLVGAVVELSLTDLRLRRRAVHPHRRCGCMPAGEPSRGATGGR
jgi:hypothetical protein